MEQFIKCKCSFKNNKSFSLNGKEVVRLATPGDEFINHVLNMIYCTALIGNNCYQTGKQREAAAYKQIIQYELLWRLATDGIVEYKAKNRKQNDTEEITTSSTKFAIEVDGRYSTPKAHTPTTKIEELHCEHIVPRTALAKYLISDVNLFKTHTKSEIFEFIFTHSQIAVCTKDEQETLDQECKTKMSKEWHDANLKDKQCHMFCRFYKASVCLDRYSKSQNQFIRVVYP